jgi:hypothetical protein
MNEKTLNTHLEKLHQFDNERRGWLALSVFVITAVLGIIFNWPFIDKNHLVWAVMSVAFVTSITWWYWTMKVVRHLIESKEAEYRLLYQIVEDVQIIRAEVKETFTNIVDKSK